MNFRYKGLRVCCSLLLLLWGLEPAAHAQRGVTVKVDENSLRKIAVKRVMPGYPEESIKKGAKGVTVTELTVNSKGDVVELEVLEAPDEVIKQAVAGAVNQWKFKPTAAEGRPVSLKGKLTFYFVIDGRGGARVENPRQFGEQ